MQSFQNLSTVSVNGNDLRELSILTPWRSFFAIFSEWFIIISCIIISKTYPGIFIYLISWFIISTRLYAMYSLIHDAIHYSISRNKSFNDFIAQVFLGFPIFISLGTIRRNHLNHHKFLQTADDPEMKHLYYDEFHFPKSKFEIAKLFLFDISGLNFIKYKLMKLVYIIRHINQLEAKEFLSILTVLVTFVALYYIGIAKDILLFWIIPYATLYQTLNRIRLSTEHFNITDVNLFKTRSVIPSVIEKFFFTPYNLGYHVEHHLYPSVPFYNLPKLHEILMKKADYKENVIVHTSYIRVLKDFIR